MTRSRHPTYIAVGALALALLPAFWPSGAMAYTCDEPFSTDLIAGQTIDAGDVKVCNDDTNLTVTYEATFPWCLLKTNLHVATSKSGIPQTKQGNPKPDEFAHGDDYGGCLDGPATFEIPLDKIDGGVSPGDTVFIAAHAEVENGEREEGAWGNGTRFVQRGNWAMYFTYAVQETSSCVTAGGVEVGGACWFAAVPGGSCAAACAAAGGSYDEATRDFAGSGAQASLANCLSVLAAVGLPQTGEPGDEICGAGLGCMHEFLSDLRLRCVSPPTEPDASASGAERACACKF